MTFRIYFLLLLLISTIILVVWYDVIYDSEKYSDFNTIIVKDSLNSGSNSIKIDPLIKFSWCPPNYDHESANQEPDLDCESLFSGKRWAVARYKLWKPQYSFEDKIMMEITANCSRLKRDFPFYQPPQVVFESEFPLAFVVIVSENAEQLIRLFQTIYRPWNLYCLTYDEHASQEFKRTMRNLHECFDNIIMPKRFYGIFWAGFSITKATMGCLELLNEHMNGWRYVQILSWNDVPLKTNRQMVEIIRIFNGSQDVELSEGQPERFRQYHRETDVDGNKRGWKKPLPPGNLLIYKSSMAVTVSREFVRFISHSPVARDFFNWSESVWAAEEQFMSTLVHNLHTGVPGGFPGACLPYFDFDKTEKRTVSRFQVWYENCSGELTGGSCHFGVGDLDKMKSRPEMVAHKIYLDYEPATFYCLWQLHFKKTFNIVNSTLDLHYYHDLPAVRYQNIVDKSKFQC